MRELRAASKAASVRIEAETVADAISQEIVPSAHIDELLRECPGAVARLRRRDVLPVAHVPDNAVKMGSSVPTVSECKHVRVRLEYDDVSQWMCGACGALLS